MSVFYSIHTLLTTTYFILEKKSHGTNLDESGKEIEKLGCGID